MMGALQKTGQFAAKNGRAARVMLFRDGCEMCYGMVKSCDANRAKKTKRRGELS